MRDSNILPRRHPGPWAGRGGRRPEAGDAEGGSSPAGSNASHDVLSLWMQVLPAKTSPPPPSSSDGLRAEALEALGVGAVLGFLLVVAAIGIAIALVARRRPTELEPPPPEPSDESPPPLWRP